MLCPKCRSWNFRDYRFCRECGAKLDPASTPPDDTVDPRVEELLRQAFGALDRGELDTSLNKIQEALALQPGSAPAHSALGAIYERRGMIPEAIQQVEMALQLNPDCTADREKLERLRRQIPPAPRSFATSRTQIAGATAIIAATLVFGIGAAVLLRPQPASQNGKPTVPGAPSTAASRKAAAHASTAKAWGVPSPGAATQPGSAPGSNTLTATPVTTPPVPGNSSSSNANPGTAWGSPLGAAPSSNPTASAKLPDLPAHPTQDLAPAPVGRVQPLEPAADETGSQPDASPTTPSAPGGSLTTAEPSEPESGFIQIEAGGGARPETQATRAPGEPVRQVSAPPAPPRIEISIGRGAGGSRGNSVSASPQPASGSGLAGAKRTERQAFSAFHRGESSEAGRLFRLAERQYGGIAARGGSEAGQAAEGLATCRQMLDRLR